MDGEQDRGEASVADRDGENPVHHWPHLTVFNWIQVNGHSITGVRTY